MRPTGSDACGHKTDNSLTMCVMSVLPKRNQLQETRKWAQPTGCPLSHQSPRKLGTSYGVSQLISKLREVSSHENWYIYIMRKSCDRWLCTQSRSRKGPCAKVWDVRVRWLCTVCDSCEGCQLKGDYTLMIPLFFSLRKRMMIPD